MGQNPPTELSKSRATPANDKPRIHSKFNPKQPNARHHPPRTQRNNHSSLADESRAVRGRVHALVRLPLIEIFQRAPTTSTGIIQRTPRDLQHRMKRGGAASQITTQDEQGQPRALTERQVSRTLSFNSQQPNARINRAGNIEPSIQVLRMKGKLIPLRLNELLCRPWLKSTT